MITGRKSGRREYISIWWDKTSIDFTTVNPKNRYTRIKNIMTNNNLRDCYYREISTGAGDDALYDYTNNAKLAFAMRKAGGCL